MDPQTEKLVQLISEFDQLIMNPQVKVLQWNSHSEAGIKENTKIGDVYRSYVCNGTTTHTLTFTVYDPAKDKR